MTLARSADIKWRRTTHGTVRHAVRFSGWIDGSVSVCGEVSRPWEQWHADPSKPEHDACARRLEAEPADDA